MAQKNYKPAGARIPQVDTTTYGGGLKTPEKAPKKRVRRARKSAETNAQTLITRRNLLLGAAGVGVVAAGAAGAVRLAQQESSDEEDIATLEVPEDAVFDLEACAEVDPADAFELIGDYELPFGTLIWADDDNVAACLFPTDEPAPLVHMGILQLGNGSYYIMREAAVGAEEGFEIYDVRASSEGLVWMESAVMQGLWRIYVASLDSALNLGEAVLVDEGNAALEVPSITVVGEHAFWQTMAPISNENARREPAVVKRAHMTTGKTDVVFNSIGRMSAPPTSYENSVIISPRHPDATSYCDLVRIQAETGAVLDTLTLPSGMLPNQVGYGPTGFAFCFENIYDYGAGIANLGTYTPARAHGNDYADLEWFRFNRTPTAAPCWCSDAWFMVKSNQSVCAVNFDNKVFCSFGAESGCLDWGDFLVSSGKHDTVVGAMQIDQVSTEGEETKMTQVRVWRPLASAPANPNTDANTSNNEQENEEA